jgi:hypothetical protein
MRKVFKLTVLFLLLFAPFFLPCCNSEQKETTGNITIIDDSVYGLQAGFAAIPITPEVPDTWNDINGDAAFNLKDGDTFTDGNNNGRFDPVWIAGFGNKRAANGVHDDLWARTMVIDDGKTRIAIVSLDVIGFMNNHVNDVRTMIPAETGITYLIITSTHTHEAPDLLGLWGNSYLKSGVDRKYLEFVKKQIIKSVEVATNNISPVRLEVSEDLTGAIPLVRDSRKPEVLDPGLRIIRVISKDKGITTGSLISWGDHPETLWGKNLQITSDFPHYVRENVEKGIFNGDSLYMTGTGGISVYVNGAVGGLMTTSPGLAIKDIFTGTAYKDPSFEKAKAQGEQLARLILNTMKSPVEKIDSAAISLVVRPLTIPLSNRLFKLAKVLGVLDRGSSGLKYIKTELAVFKIGPISFVTLPGEIYPEIINGGVEAPEGNDFHIEPAEVPPVRDLMPGKYKFIIGLANDEIGYIIPKSEWDTKPPFTYGRDKAPYGEENSMGPETAVLIHRKLQEMLIVLKQGSSLP